MMGRVPRRPALAAALLVTALALTGCTTGTPGPDRPSASPTRAAAVRFAQQDAARPVVVAASTAPARAVQASRVFFAASPGVVVASDGDAAGQRAAGAVAERLHVPMLLLPADPTAMPTPAGASSSPSATLSASASGGSSSAAAGVRAAVAGEVRRLGAEWVAGADAPRLPGVRALALGAAPAVTVPARPVSTVVAGSSSADTAALATARAAGATVVGLSAGQELPGASSDAVTALAKAADDPAMLIGSVFARLEDPTWAVAAARTGYQYPGGGQVPFDGRLFVALYGTPSDGVLGVLGRQGPQATIDRVKALAGQYRALVDRPVAPMLEVIATVAAGTPTDDGDYSSEIDVSALEPYVDRAAAAGVPVVLDLQPGRSDFLTQAKAYRTLLEKPNVGLALDPEWRLGPGQRPLVQIGRVSAAEVNRTSAWLADLVRERGLPPKPFVLHQFRLTMLQDRSSIVVDRPELDVLIHVDGQGGQPDKQATWRAVRQGAPKVAWGWKNFLEKDTPVLTPRQTIQQVHPTPDLITYQ